MRQRGLVLGRAGLGMAVCAGWLSLGACQKAAETPKAVGPDVWATVDGREIRRDEVEKVYRNNLNPAAPLPSDEEALTLKLNILDELITQDLLHARAKSGGAEPTDADVEKAFTERKGSMTDDAFNLELTQRGVTQDDVKRGIRRELAVQKVMEQEVGSKAKATDQDITSFYEKNKAQFNLPEAQYRLSQIVITPVREAQLANRMRDDATTPEEAARKAQALSERLKGGADFSAVAMDYSEDAQTAPRGGELGFVPVSALNRLQPDFRNAVLRMQPGNIQTLTINGAHTFVMLLAKEDAGQRDLSSASVKDMIRDGLQQRKQELLQSAFLSNVRSDAKIVNHLAREIVAAQGKAPGLAAMTSPLGTAAPPAPAASAAPPARP